jgi:hypothetical protein
MAMIPPPEGLSAEDYDAIEEAVVDEMRQMLDGLAKLEQTVREQHLPADPSIRLLVQRLKDVSQTLEGLAATMRTDGIEERYCGDIETQARAVAGLLRSAPQVKSEVVKADTGRAEAPRLEPRPAPLPAPIPAMSAARVLDAPPARFAPQISVSQRAEPGALTRLDRLSTAEKVALFS